MTSGPTVIAIDGPSGVGKSTIAREVASRTGLPFLETGAMYRALGWKLMQEGIDPGDRDTVEELATRLDIQLARRPDGSVEIRLDGEPLDERVRSPEVSAITSIASSYPAVRLRMVELQRQFASENGAVMEGRDIGSRVFPDTRFKFFLTAPQRVRVERRLAQLRKAGASALSSEELEAEIVARDRRDTRRAASPLVMDESYTEIDTAEKSVEEVVEQILLQVAANPARADDC